MYIYICTCTYIIYIYIHTCMYVCMYVYIYMCVCAQSHKCFDATDFLPLTPLGHIGKLLKAPAVC